MKWIPLLFLAACASPPPSQYERGTFRLPPPAPTRPGVGLPVPHMPGQHVVPQVQPQPRHKRYLPPEPDGRQGIWAGDGEDDPNDGWHPPIRTVGEPIPRIAIADVEIPTISEARDAVDTISTEQCAYITRLNILEAKIGYKVLRLSREEQACLIASAMAGCQEWMFASWIATIETAQKAGIPLDEDPTDRLHYGRLSVALMAKWKSEACGIHGAESRAVRKYMKALAEAAGRLQPKGGGEGAH